MVGAFVTYFYTGEVPHVVLEPNLSSFLALSELYNLLPLKAQAEDLAIRSLKMENVVELFSLASIHDAGILLEATNFFILVTRRPSGSRTLVRSLSAS